MIIEGRENPNSDPGNILSASFRAQTFVQNGRYYDQKGQYSQAVKYYGLAQTKFANLLKQFPKVPLTPQWELEIRLAHQRINQLKSKATPQKLRSKDDQQYAEMKARVLSCRVKPNPNLTRQDVIGLHHIWRELEDVVIDPLIYPELLHTNPDFPRTILLNGPPGCGKSFLMNVLAAVAPITLFLVTPGLIYQKWMGESQKMVQVLYETAWEYAPSVIFIDEFDKLFNSSVTRLNGGTEASQTGMQIESELQQYLSGMRTPLVNPTVTIAATNEPWQMDAAMRRRFARILYIGPPGSFTIEQLIVRNFRHTQHDLTENHVQWLANELERHSPAEIAKICSIAHMTAHKQARDQGFTEVVSLKDMFDAIPTVAPALELWAEHSTRYKSKLTKYREWNDQYSIPKIEHLGWEWELKPREKTRNPIQLKVFDESQPVKWKKD
ncbi:MAG: AAA family ATPase [Candidatus Thorarchaeota archaeon]